MTELEQLIAMMPEGNLRRAIELLSLGQANSADRADIESAMSYQRKIAKLEAENASILLANKLAVDALAWTHADPISPELEGASWPAVFRAIKKILPPGQARRAMGVALAGLIATPERERWVRNIGPGLTIHGTQEAIAAVTAVENSLNDARRDAEIAKAQSRRLVVDISQRDGKVQELQRVNAVAQDTINSLRSSLSHALGAQIRRDPADVARIEQLEETVRRLYGHVSRGEPLPANP